MKLKTGIMLSVLAIVLVVGTIGTVGYFQYKKNTEQLENSISTLNQDAEQNGVNMTYDICPTLNSDRTQVVCYMTYLGLKMKFIKDEYMDAPQDHDNVEALNKRIAQEVDDVCTQMEGNKYAVEPCEQAKFQASLQVRAIEILRTADELPEIKSWLEVYSNASSQISSGQCPYLNVDFNELGDEQRSTVDTCMNNKGWWKIIYYNPVAGGEDYKMTIYVDDQGSLKLKE